MSTKSTTTGNNNLAMMTTLPQQKLLYNIKEQMREPCGTPQNAQFTMNERQKALLRRKSGLEMLNNDVALIKLSESDNRSDLLKQHKSKIQRKYPRDKRLVISLKSSKSSVFDEKFSDRYEKVRLKNITFGQII